MEARVPFVDLEFMKYVLPLEEKFLPGNIDQWILRDAFDDSENPYLPENFIWEEKISIPKEGIQIVSSAME